MLTKLKAKAVKLIEMFNSKVKTRKKHMTMDDFQNGIFPWDADIEDELENPSKTRKFMM